MRNIKTLIVSLLISAVALAAATTAQADTVLALQEDGGAIVVVATGPSLSALSYTNTFGDFQVSIFGTAESNSATFSQILSSTTSISNNSAGTHTLSLYVSSQDFSLPTGPILQDESGMGGSLNSGAVTPTFQAFADKNNNTLANGATCGLACADYTNGLQTGVFNGSTFQTGSATGNFTRLGTSYSMTTVTTFVLAGSSTVNYSSHENVTGSNCSSGIGDFVWNDLNHNGIQDSGEPGISGITVQLMDSSNNLLATTTTDSNGKYGFAGLCGGNYIVTIPSQSGLTGPGFVSTVTGQGTTDTDSNGTPQSSAPPQTASVNLPNNTIDNSIDFGYFVPAPCNSGIGDFVWNDTNNNGIQDAGEPGIPNITVQLFDSAGNLVRSTTTDSSGFYHFSGLCGGTYNVVIPSQSGLIGYVSTLAFQGGSNQLDSNGTPASALPPQTAQVILPNNFTDNSIDFGYYPAPACPAGSFKFSYDASGNLNITYDQFPAPNDNSYGVNAVGWTNGHKFSDLVGSDHAGFELVDQNGVVQLSFNIDYISQVTTGTVPPSGYKSLGPFGGDGKILVGTLTPSDISYDSSLARNLNNVNIPGLFNPTTHAQQFGSVNVLQNSPPTDAQHQTYNISDPSLANWDFHDTYFVTINAAKLASIGFNPATWQVLPNLDQLHNSPAKACPGGTTSTLKLTFPSGANGTVGAAYSVTLAATGGVGPYTYSVSAGTLPAGLSLNASTGAITGTPTSPVSGPAANITFKVTDSESPAASTTASGAINIAAPPALKLPFPSGTNGKVGTPYSVTLAATGGVGPYTYSVSAGTLPAGLSLNPSTGAITGTPTTPVSGPAANITFKVTDSQSPAASATASGAINIAAPPALKLPFPAGTNGKVGTPYSVTLAATGGVGPYTYSVSAGTLPAGLSLNASTGAITGTPTSPVSGPAANITFKVTDSQSPAASATASGAINIGQ